jgi:photosystem II stability/assembly factor-like uncharacterized protein
MLATGSTASLRGLSVQGDNVIWASGTEGTVLRTTDGGRTWNVRKVMGAENLDLRDVHAFNANVAVAMATAGRLFRTTDGGATWQTVYAAADTTVFLDAISFWDESHGIVLGDPMPERASSIRGNASEPVPRDSVARRFLILLTEDGGRTWSELPSRVSPRAEPGEAAFAASGTPLAVAGDRHAWFGSGAGTSARLFRSENRGRTWEATTTPVEAGAPSAGIFAVVFSDTLNAVIAGGDYRRPAAGTRNVAFTRDGGRTFATPGALPAQYVSTIAWANGRVLMAGGIAGIVYSPVDHFQWQVVDAGNWNSLAASEKHVWAVGPEGRVGRISNRR